MSKIQDDIIKIAYKKLKQMIYYEKTHLFLRKRLAEFECTEDFEERLRIIDTVIKTKVPTKEKAFQDWLNEINFVLLPKGVSGIDSQSEKGKGTYVTNVTSQENYKIEKVNYIFDGPIELHLIAVLWLMIDGSEIDSKLTRNCMGSRLHPLVGQDEDHSAQLFKKYHELYAKWRDDGIKKARDLLVNEEQSICIIALDLQEYYYRVQIDWIKLRTQTVRPNKTTGFYKTVFAREILGSQLFDCIEAICTAYRQRIAPQLKITHGDIPDNATCLPIGLCASPLIANWYLKEFDEAILTKVRPAYYGRYVDDILLVVTSQFEPTNDPIRSFMEEILVNTGVMQHDVNNLRYELTGTPGLFLQEQKCILQFFDAGHSIAGLEKFQKEIEENASDFAMLPVEGDESPVEQVAYDLLYDGSVNKIRSIKEIAENRWELAKHLSKQTRLFLVAEGRLDTQTRKELFRFFKGRNAIDYWDMWERVIAFLVIAGNKKTVDEFCKAIRSEIKKMSFSKLDDGNISDLLRRAMMAHLDVSLEMIHAVRDTETSKDSVLEHWRTSNLIRHHLVAVPLLNYTEFNGDLAIPGYVADFILDDHKIKWSPRFVHFDECLGFSDSGYFAVTDGDSITTANQIYAKFHGSSVEDVISESADGEL
ncbi:hypothetical protein SAMN06296273_0047 [Nitrosomonas ureae]|uniref:Reverse transcriptase domain-containing protein n=1 Tax=Nitrosomonas ureae TaxID=44577 RepID=A0A285BUE8_9PROT|nr:reverse transcriptase domain-containing protein [Nitrosomonas ureae]SNX58586.1 hypothetical protein SAMN06296273_0047 [Nitrosomonas ureae]